MSKYKMAYKMLTNKIEVTYHEKQPFWKYSKVYMIYKVLKGDYGCRKQTEQHEHETIEQPTPTETSLHGNFDLNLLNNYSTRQESKSKINNHIQIINGVLQSQQLNASVQDFIIAPSKITYELYVNDTDLNKVLKLNNVLSMRLQSPSVNISILHKNGTVGVILPRQHRLKVSLKHLLTIQDNAKLKIPLGIDLTNNPIIGDLHNMTHLLIGGQTGGGKSVCINNILISLLHQHTSDTLKLILIDCKKLELMPYKNIPHLLKPVITNGNEAEKVLYWLVDEMERRYTLMSKANARNLESYNKKGHKLPYIVTVIDELSNLRKGDIDIDTPIESLAEKARAAGIHLVIATQNPNKDVVTPVIKANLPTSIAFKVKDHYKSSVILGQKGAETLLKHGDMIINGQGYDMLRLQGTYIDEKEVDRVLKTFNTSHQETEDTEEYTETKFTHYDNEDLKQLIAPTDKINKNKHDPLFDKVARFFIKRGKGSTNSIRNNFKTSRGTSVGYSRAKKIVDSLILEGILGEKDEQGYPVLITLEEYEKL